jgi:hypothetical protein
MLHSFVSKVGQSGAQKWSTLLNDHPWCFLFKMMSPRLVLKFECKFLTGLLRVHLIHQGLGRRAIHIFAIGSSLPSLPLEVDELGTSS